MTIGGTDPFGRDLAPGPGEGEDPPVVLPVEDALDLHAFAPRDVPDVVRDYLEACVEHGFREVRLIHGRGTGTQRRVVRSVLAAHPLVEEFADSPPERGGWGATVVRLRDAPPASAHGPLAESE
jgi:DNA-nicking Smr family endonuclease